VLIFDEPTEHLDPAAGDALVGDLLAATTGRTVVWITHRFDHLDRFDGVLELHMGRQASSCDSLEYVKPLVAGAT
jgi:ABC-type transport system involved in cytochrome bd biosynthesis fused ATPase/permease subunit